MSMIGLFQVIEKLKSNEHRSIYRVKDANGKVVILKLLHRVGYAHSDGIKIRREFALASQLSEDYVVKVIEEGVIEGAPFLTCEDFSAVSLKKIQNGKPIPLGVFFELALKMVSCIIYCHSKGVVHRDINPSNFIVSNDLSTVKLNDFGMAEWLANIDSQEIQMGVLQGTIHYLSPEQTGRIQIPTDFRTDLYALGVTFYELLVGKLPFVSAENDILELVHMHLAAMPIPLNHVDSMIPKTLSDIVMKLLQKSPDERYQSAYGLKEDLSKLKLLWERQDRVMFEIGTRDIPASFKVSKQVYGRTDSITTLVSKSLMVKNDSRQSLMIRGSKGVGKTFILDYLETTLKNEGAFVFHVQCDGYDYQQPYWGFSEAIEDWVNQQLCESDEYVSRIVEEIIRTIGPNLGLLTQLFPSLENFVGMQVYEVSSNPVETRMRFNIAFFNLLMLMKNDSNSVVFSIDNVHLADESTLKLLAYLLTATENLPFMLLGTSLDDEKVISSQALRDFLTDLSITQVSLESFSLENLTDIIFDAFRMSKAQSQALSEVTYSKTLGNPYAVMTFLQQRCDEKMLYFDYKSGQWVFSLTDIHDAPVAEHIFEQQYALLKDLDLPTRVLLNTAAALPLKFSTSRLLALLEIPFDVFTQSLSLVVEHGIIKASHPIKDALVFQQFEILDPQLRFSDLTFRDYLLTAIPELDRTALHLRIGMLLYHAYEMRGDLLHIDELLHNLNLVVGSVADEMVRFQLARFNLKRAQIAKQSVAYDIALYNIKQALVALPNDHFEKSYALSFDIYILHAELLYLNREFEASERTFDNLYGKARSTMDQVRVNRIKLVLFVNLGETHRVVDLAFKTLALLDFKLTDHISLPRMVVQLIGLQTVNVIHKPKLILEMPVSSNERAIVALEILNLLISVSYLVSKILFIRIILTMLSLSVKYGAMRLTPFAFATYGIVEGAAFGRYHKAFEIGKASLEAAKRSGDGEALSKVNFTLGFFLSHWVNHISESISFLEAGREQSYYCGNMVYFAYNTAGIFLARLAAGANMLELCQDCENELKNPDIMMDKDVSNLLVAILQYTRAQSLGTANNSVAIEAVLSQDHFELEAFERELRASNMPSILAHYLILKMKLNFTLGSYERVLAFYREVKPLLGELIGLYISVEASYYSALAYLALQMDSDNLRKEDYKGSVPIGAIKSKLFKLKSLNPANFAHKYDHLMARIYQQRGQVDKAHQTFHRAIKSAHDHGFYQEEAFICEDIANLYNSEGNEKLRRIFLKEAYFLFRQLGCLVKCHLMTIQYTEISFDQIERLLFSEKQTRQSITQSQNELDTLYIMKASQRLSAEFDTNRLMETVLLLLLEVSGAQKAVLMLKIQNLEIVSTCINGVYTMLPEPEPIYGNEIVPVAIANYVNRTQKSILLDWACEKAQFKEDAYVKKHQLKSVLCLPFFYKSEYIGMIYLENNLITAAFFENRLEVINIILSQYAIAYDNAKLYRNFELSQSQLMEHRENLTNLVNERTLELSKTKLAIETLLDQVGQGFLSINSDGFVNPAFSKECLTIFSHDIANESFVELLKTHAQAIDIYFIETVLNKIFEFDEEEVAEIYLSLLPEVLTIGEQIIQCRYRYINNLHIQQITVVLTDITNRVTMEREVEDERRTLRMVVNVIRYQNNVRSSIKRLRAFFNQDYHNILAGKATNEKTREIYRIIHTFKGDFAQWSMMNTAKHLHAVESDISALFLKKEDVRSKSIKDYLENISIDAILHEDYARIESYLGTDFIEGNQIVQISDDDFDKVQQELVRSVPQEYQSKVTGVFRQLKWVQFDIVISQYSDYVVQLASSFDKKIMPIVLTGSSLKLDDAIYLDFLKSLIHIFRNIVQYGIENSEIRAFEQKDLEGLIRVDVMKDEKQFQIIIEDDGAGLDMVSIDSRLALMGSPLIHADVWTRQQAIFDYGFSTQENLTELSGRGVGLNAVKSAIENLGGHIEVTSKFGVFTRFTCTIPIIDWQKKSD